MLKELRGSSKSSDGKDIVVIPFVHLTESMC